MLGNTTASHVEDALENEMLEKILENETKFLGKLTLSKSRDFNQH